MLFLSSPNATPKATRPTGDSSTTATPWAGVAFEADVRLSVKPCGDVWPHVNAPSGLKASLNLGQRGAIGDRTIVGRALLEVASLSA